MDRCGLVRHSERIPVGLSGDYQAMRGTQSATPAPGAGTVPADTQAVVANMPLHAVPEDFDWSNTMTTLRDRYTEHRRASNWRAALAYGDAVDDIRADLLEAFVRFGGDADSLASDNHEDIFRAMQALLDQATQAGDTAEATRLTDYLAALNQQTYDAFADLAGRSDEFEGAARGTLQPLDPHIDQQKLLDWLQAQEDAAMQRMAGVADPDAIQAANHEVTYFRQMITAMEDGRNPLTESGDQIAFLRRVDPDQVAIYEDFHGRLLQALSDPSFHKSAAEMGDATYAPVVHLRPELGSPASPIAQNGISTQVFNPEIAEPGVRVVEFSNGDYATNRELINTRIGDDDFARVPAQQPAWIAPAQSQGPRSILKPGDPGPIDLSEGRIVNRGPDGEYISDESVRLWSLDTMEAANAESILRQGGFGNYMDALANQRSPWQRMADNATMNPYAVARTDAANQMWDTMRIRDTRPPSEWPRAPTRQGMRSWDNAARGRKSVRFGDASVLTVGADAEDVLAIRTQWRELGTDDVAMPWWTGSGINRATEPLNADEAVRHVPTPRTANSRPGFPSKWRAGRQPGFDRLADAPGAFPFSTREQLVLDLMQGQRIDVRHIDVLAGALDDAARTGWVRNKEWREDGRPAAQPSPGICGGGFLCPDPRLAHFGQAARYARLGGIASVARVSEARSLVFPRAIALGARPLTLPGGTSVLVVSAFYAFRLSDGAPLLPATWYETVAAHAGPLAVPDSMVPLPGSELIVLGAVPGVEDRTRPAQVRCGSLTLDVLLHRDPEQPGAPFVPDWNAAVWHEDDNPLGRGGPDDERSALIVARNDAEQPVWFGSTPFDHPLRLRCVGTPDAASGTGWPSDASPDVLYEAHPALWADTFSPADPLAFEGLSAAPLNARLPPYRITITSGRQDARFVVESARIHGVSVIPAADAGAMFWRVAIDLGDDILGESIQAIVGALEDVDSLQRDAEHWGRIAVARWLEPDTAMDDRPLLPRKLAAAVVLPFAMADDDPMKERHAAAEEWMKGEVGMSETNPFGELAPPEESALADQLIEASEKNDAPPDANEIDEMASRLLAASRRRHEEAGFKERPPESERAPEVRGERLNAEIEQRLSGPYQSLRDRNIANTIHAKQVDVWTPAR